ncbi:hypothetical protein GCM10010191_87420 [Actinomadura vinacea]|uniref:histidine kinase n=1 Tax=Actinomadura vinacea TaxID=115336 RepID=A0ABP5XJ96_9ACTN
MDRAAVRRRGWAGRTQRIAGHHHLLIVVGTLLGLLSLAEVVLGLLLDRGPVAQLAASSSSARTERVLFTVLVCLLCLITTLPAALPRPRGAATAISAAGVTSLLILESVTAAGMAAQMIVAGRLGRAGDRLPTLLVGVPFLVLALAGPQDAEARVRTVLLASLVPISALAGLGHRARLDARESTATRNAIAGTILENTARGERARIARELHDVVAHHISMVAIQAETARLATRGMPPEGAERLLDIGDTAREALTEMRRLLGVLREDTRTGAAVEGSGGEPAGGERSGGERHPQPGLGQLNGLLDEARAASGSALRLIIRGPPEPLDPGVELVAYRIVQESLTNARRHAPGAAIDVELLYTQDALWLRVRDNGPGPSPTARPGGHGLLGMRERAAAVGGRVQAGPVSGVGFLVEATLPTKTEGAR